MPAILTLNAKLIRRSFSYTAMQIGTYLQMWYAIITVIITLFRHGLSNSPFVSTAPISVFKVIVIL